ncbi:Hachiman antiphage defense system protein HamA [Peribacillus frigoritolerans]|uniref:Hachiman antiphage defense system protein HamA n=1 Tax=Peribacillus frigoritolerans TaxID=450367 RepID=UPI002EC8CFD6|nr:Hachiman antiphage defense system protein HamA [Peribacillus frigoritolerans]
MSESVKNQCSLLGEHPRQSLFAEWLSCEDIPIVDNKIHRKLIEVSGMRNHAIEQIAEWIIKHHIADKKLSRLKRKKEEILKKYGLEEYLKQQQMLPVAEKTMRGNGAEVVLAEYLQESTQLKNLLYRLQYNPNVNQSMKGDDVLLFNKENLRDKVIIGESKFRKTPNKAVVKEITDEFGKKLKLPLSILFVASLLSAKGEEDLADELEELNIEVQHGNVPVINVGLLLSNHNTASNVETHLISENPHFVILSLGIDNPEELITKSFALANEKIIRGIENED